MESGSEGEEAFGGAPQGIFFAAGGFRGCRASSKACFALSYYFICLLVMVVVGVFVDVVVASVVVPFMVWCCCLVLDCVAGRGYCVLGARLGLEALEITTHFFVVLRS